jgi:hypothetical protein
MKNKEQKLNCRYCKSGYAKLQPHYNLALDEIEYFCIICGCKN